MSDSLHQSSATNRNKLSFGSHRSLVSTYAQELGPVSQLKSHSMQLLRLLSPNLMGCSYCKTQTPNPAFATGAKAGKCPSLLGEVLLLFADLYHILVTLFSCESFYIMTMVVMAHGKVCFFFSGFGSEQHYTPVFLNK